MSIAAAVIAAFFDGGPALWITYLVLTLGLHGLFAYLMRAPTLSGRLIMDRIEGFRMYLDTAEQDRLDQMRSPPAHARGIRGFPCPMLTPWASKTTGAGVLPANCPGMPTGRPLTIPPGIAVIFGAPAHCITWVMTSAVLFPLPSHRPRPRRDPRPAPEAEVSPAAVAAAVAAVAGKPEPGGAARTAGH